MIKLLVDKNIFQAEKFLPSEVNLTTYDPNDGFPDNLEDYSALFVRTVTKLNQQTLPSTLGNLEFVGTASSGTDHVDIPYLESQGIEFASAAGCNARAVAEYIATSLLLWADSNSKDLSTLKVGIVGVGHVGTKVDEILSDLSIDTVLYDPPREIREPSFKSDSLQNVLDADILTLHVPLNKTGKYATYHWLNEEKLKNHEFQMVINASRGGVVDEKSLLKHYQDGDIHDFILDVWENEPNFSVEMAQKAFISTPHIAGYSYLAKQNATRMIYEPFCKHFNIEMPNPTDEEAYEKIKDLDPESQSFSAILKKLHPIMEYHDSLRSICNLDTAERAKSFRKLRTNRPFRTEFEEIQIPDQVLDKYPVLKKLGVQSL